MNDRSSSIEMPATTPATADVAAPGHHRPAPVPTQRAGDMHPARPAGATTASGLRQPVGTPQRRWSARASSRSGPEVLVAAAVNAATGEVWFQVGGGRPAVMEPAALSELRQMLGMVLAQALTDRGSW